MVAAVIALALVAVGIVLATRKDSSSSSAATTTAPIDTRPVTTPPTTAAPTTARTTVAPTTAAPTTAAATTTVAPTTAPPTTSGASTTLPAGAIPSVKLSGTGSTVEKWPWPAGKQAILRFQQQGDAAFTVETLNAANQTIDFPIVAFADKTGAVLTRNVEGATSLKITATGPWTLSFDDVSTAKPFTQSVQGTDKDVVRWEGPPSVVRAVNEGTDTFQVQAFYDSGDYDIVVNEIGPADVKAPLKAGPALLTIQAQGPWSLTVQP